MTIQVEPAKLLLYATPAHDCSHLPGTDATTLFVDPEYPKDPGVYTLRWLRRGVNRVTGTRTGTQAAQPWQFGR
jgi:hypothetical protein